ncbi:MAG: O-antigen ligase family protein [Lyngbya sp.]|nr:O-antigen ligase family protein [Lyngbya sp.]
MKDTIKSLLSMVPLFALVPLSLGIIVILIVFHLAGEHKKFALILEKIIIFGFFVLIPNLTPYPLPNLHPSYFTTPDVPIPWKLIQIALYATLFFVLLSRFRYIFRAIIVIFKDIGLGLLLFLIACSFLWSVTPDFTLTASLTVLGPTLFAAYVGKQYNWQELSWFIRWSTSTLALLSFYYARFKPDIGVHSKGWMGVTGHPNIIAPILAINIVLWTAHAIAYPKDRKIALVMIIFSLYVRQQTNSSTSIVVLFLLMCLLMVLLFFKHLNYKQALTGFILFLVVAIGLTIFVSSNFEYVIVDVLGKDITLTGRVPVWNLVLEKAVSQRPLLGYGYYGFWQKWRGEDDPSRYMITENGFRPRHGHQGFLDLAVDLGLIGLSFFLLSICRYIALGVKYLVTDSKIESTFSLLFLTFLIILNLSESFLLKPSHVWVYYVISSVRLSLDTEKNVSLNRSSNRSLKQ